MGAFNRLLLDATCPECGSEQRALEFQFKYGSCVGATYRLGDEVRWDEGIEYISEPPGGDWATLAAAECPACGAAVEASVEIVAGALRSATIGSPGDFLRCFACRRHLAPVPTDGEWTSAWIGGAADYGRYLCRACRDRAIASGVTGPDKVCGWCGKWRPALCWRDSHAICELCAADR